ncbi:MAG: hypothetical protein AAF688_06605 [Bacteroidota bacterium]
MQINPKQIQALYRFTREHFVEHYDLQTELVDHLANDIEQIWEESPNLSFEEARDKSFKKFGVFGFLEVVEKRQKAMNKRYFKYLKNELVKWFGWPKLLTTLFILIACYLGFASNYAKYFFLATYIPISIWLCYRGIALTRTYEKRKIRSDKKWMLEEMIFKQAGAFGVILLSQLPTQFLNIEEKMTNPYLIMLFTGITAFLIISFYISYHLLPNKAEELLKDTYPEYKTAIL